MGGGHHARRDQQAVAGQEEAEKQARFREDDREQADVPEGDEQLLEVEAGQNASVRVAPRARWDGHQRESSPAPTGVAGDAHDGQRVDVEALAAFAGLARRRPVDRLRCTPGPPGPPPGRTSRRSAA